MDVEAVAVVPAAAPAVGGVARVRLRAFSIVRQAVLEASASRFEAVGRELVEAEAEPDVVVGGERMTEARRRGRRGLWFVRVFEEDPLVVVSTLLLASVLGWLCRLAPQDAASPGTWIGASRCSSPPSPEGSGLGLAVIRRSSGNASDQPSIPLLAVPLSGFGVLDELDRVPLPKISPVV